MKTTLNICSCFVSLTTALLSCAAFNLNAQVYTASEDYTLISTYLGQGNASVNGGQVVQNNSCVPTSTANGLAYLEAYQTQVLYNSDPFAVTPDNYTAVNALQTAMGTTAAGTTTSGELNGLQNYLSTVNPGSSVTISAQASLAEPASFFGAGVNAGISLQNANPTAQFLANALNANDAVQLGILWGTISGGNSTNFTYNGGHFVSLDSLNLNNGSGTIGILDPWGSGGVNAGTSASQISLSVSTITLTGLGSFLYVTYPIVAAGGPEPGEAGDTQFAGGAQAGIILVDAVESVPEPATIGLVAIGLLAALTIRRQRK